MIIESDDFENAKGAVEGAIKGYVGALAPGESLLIARIIQVAMDTGKIKNIRVLLPEGDIVPPSDVKIILKDLIIAKEHEIREEYWYAF